MKARLDSKEFSIAVKQAIKWTAYAGSAISECIGIKAVDGFVLLRATRLDQDAIIGVNAFDVKHGDVVVGASLLNEFSWDTGGWLTIEVVGNKLRMDYEDFANPEISISSESYSGFPTLMEVGGFITLPEDVLRTAATHTIPFAKSGMAIKSAVHIVPVDTGCAIIGTDGVVGYMTSLPTNIDNPMSLESTMLVTAIGAVPSPVSVGVSDHRVEVAGGESRIQFSSVSSPDPKNLPEMFSMKTADELFIGKEGIEKLRFLCSKAAAVDSDSNIYIGGDGTVTGRISSRDVAIPMFDIVSGTLEEILFKCYSFARSLKNLSDASEYKISVVTDGKIRRAIYIDSDSGRHFVSVAG